MTSEEVDRNIKEIWALFKETDARFKATDARLGKMFKETHDSFKETNARFKATDARLDKMFKKTDKRVRELAELFTGHWGKLIEALAESGILELLQERGINVSFLSRRLERSINGHHIEIDFILENEEEIVIGEVKTTLKANDVNHFIEKLDNLLLFFPKYKGYRIYGAIIGLDIEEGADKHAYRKGLFVFKIRGNNMLKLLNDIKFRPKDFAIK